MVKTKKNKVKRGLQKGETAHLNKFIKHASILIWKCILQRRRRFVLLLVETSFAFLLLLSAIFTAKPVFLTPIQSEPKPPLRTAEILNTLRKETIVGYAPNNINYITEIMNRASELLRIENVWSAVDQDTLNEMLLTESRGVPLKRPITWIIWKPRVGNTWALSIRSTERARFLSHSMDGESHNPHLQAGFLAVQLAISQAIIEHAAQTEPKYEITLAAMPVSPLMEEQKVKRTLSGILLCFTLALLPPVLETEALVVTENISRFKRALRLRNVEYTTMYVSWLIYGYLTCLPIWGLASITLILIFRWIYLIEAIMIVMAYTSVMIMIALLMGMFLNRASIACVWTTLFTLLQTYLSDLLVNHRYDRKHVALTFFLDIVFPPMGLVHAFNKFALLRTGTEEVEASTSSLIYMVASWTLINLLYFVLLMMLQRTIGQKRAIGGQVSWKSVLFNEAEMTVNYEIIFGTYKVVAQIVTSKGYPNYLTRQVTPKYIMLHRLQKDMLPLINAKISEMLQSCLYEITATNYVRPRFPGVNKEGCRKLMSWWQRLSASEMLARQEQTNFSNIRSNVLRVREERVTQFGFRVQNLFAKVGYSVIRSLTNMSIMGIPVLRNVTFDIYRCEFSMLFAERVQNTMINTLEDLITGLATPDRGSVTVLGKKLVLGTKVLTTPQMMGYCHRSDALIEDLTVREHFILYSQICLWNYDKLSVVEYSIIRTKQLLQECNLEKVTHERVRNLNIYFRAQLCWAIALLLEPRVVVIPFYTDCREYVNVIKDKIMQYRRHMTIVSFIFSSKQLEHADRIFVFDNKQLVFGGTPAYMFFRFESASAVHNRFNRNPEMQRYKNGQGRAVVAPTMIMWVPETPPLNIHGREYRAHITLQSTETTEEQLRELFARAERAGAKVRAHLGSLLILKIPANPSASVAELVKDYTANANRYGIKSFAISVPDSDEVCRRAIAACRAIDNEPVNRKSKEALKLFTENVKWERRTRCFNTHFWVIFWKFCMFHRSHTKLFLLTLVLAVLAGVLVGYSLSTMMLNIDPTSNVLSGDVQTLSVEYLNIKTTLVLRADNSSTSRSVASGYVFSDTNATKEQIKDIQYTALAREESLTEYLAIRAIDSPQLYVFLYAYGMDIFTERNGKIVVQALYSPLHHDHSAAARSVARVYMALLRHYTSKMDATIQIRDDPLMLDLSPWMRVLSTPRLMIQFMLILTITHITLLPSEEYGLIRHVQKHACNFSPFRYWITLFICDLMLFWLLASIISFVLILIVYLTVPETQLEVIDLAIVPILLSLYGVGCVPQAYIFSLGPKVALNAMAFVIVNLLSGETTLITKIFYGDVYSYVMNFMTLSPQFNMAYGFWKIEQLFMYNNECYIFQAKNLCSENSFHKCCEKCGVLQECFSRISYFNSETGLAVEITSMFVIAIFYTVLLLLIEYRIFLRLWYFATSSVTVTGMPLLTTLSPGCEREKTNVLEKRLKLRQSKQESHPFGEYLLATGVTKRCDNVYMIHNVYLGVGKGETLAVTGFKKHGRSLLCELLAGYKMPHVGNLWSMSKYNLRWQPHKYSQQVSIGCDKNTLPPWLTVREALTLIATLRGLPRIIVGEEVNKHIDALELDPDLYVSEMTRIKRTRLHFAAAVLAAPAVIVLDDFTAFEKPNIRRTMFFILNTLRKRGHAICICSTSIENHLPLANRVAILRDGTFYDVDTCDNLVKRYSKEGYTVVVHLKDDVDISLMFAKYFREFEINDTTDVLANVQVKDAGLTWADVFDRMEILKVENHQVYSYIVTGLPIDYIFNSLIEKGPGIHKTKGLFSWRWLKKLLSIKPEIMPNPQIVDKLVPLQHKYKITKLYELPWSVIFQR